MRQILISACLLSVPLPYLCLWLIGIELPYEQAAFWLVALYSFPLWLVSEPLGVPAPWVTAIVYWVLALAIVVTWEVLRRREQALAQNPRQPLGQLQRPVQAPLRVRP